MTKAAIAAFEWIAINQPPRCSKATLQKLLDRGVIAAQEETSLIMDGLPPLTRADYYVPLPVHYQWCEWADELHRGKL
jgi:hypothetical protein